MSDKIIATIKNEYFSYDVIDYGSKEWIEIKYESNFTAIPYTTDLAEIFKAFVAWQELSDYTASFYKIEKVN